MHMALAFISNDFNGYSHAEEMCDWLSCWHIRPGTIYERFEIEIALNHEQKLWILDLNIISAWFLLDLFLIILVWVLTLIK